MKCPTATIQFESTDDEHAEREIHGGRDDHQPGNQCDSQHHKCVPVRGCHVCRDKLYSGNGSNIFTAIARDSYGRKDTNSVTVNLPATNVFSYDGNGNLLSDGRRGFDYDDENQLIRVTVTNDWKTEYVYDGRMRRRIRKDFTWQSSAWVQTNEVRYIYDGNVVIQERHTNKAALTASHAGLVLWRACFNLTARCKMV